MEIKEFAAGRARWGAAEFTVLLAEFKVGVDVYLASTPGGGEERGRWHDLIAFNANTPAEL